MFVLIKIINHSYQLICESVQKRLYRVCWRIQNQHNNTTVGEAFVPGKVYVGNATYGRLNVYGYPDKRVLRIGHYCSIAERVAFILNVDHPTENISTFPFRAALMGESFEAISKGDILIDDDVWIGYGAIILSGIHIGQGAVVSAGAVVTKDVPPYAVVAGVPAKIIKYRFKDELIGELMQVDFSQLTHEQVAKHIDELYEPLRSREQLVWMGKK